MRNSSKPSLVASIGLSLMLPQAVQAEVDFSRFSIWGSSSVLLMQPSVNSSELKNWFEIYGGGYGANYSDAILAHHGSVPAQLEFTPQQLNDLANNGVTKVAVGNVIPNDKIIAIEGELAGADVKGKLRYSAAESSFIFEKSEGSGNLNATTTYQLIPRSGAAFSKGFQVLNIGKNNIFSMDSVESIMAATNAAYNISTEADQHILVMGHFSFTTVPGSTTAVVNRVRDVNAALKAQYGTQFIDIDSYVTGAQIWSDLGVTPTAEDLDYQSRGLVAPSLSADDIHLTAAAYKAVTDNLILPAVKKLFLDNPAVKNYVTLLNDGVVTALGHSTIITQQKTSQFAAQARNGRQRDWLVDRPEGLRMSIDGAYDRKKEFDAKSNELKLELAYGFENRSISFGLSRENDKVKGVGNDFSIDNKNFFIGFEQSVGPWNVGLTLGKTSGNLDGSFTSVGKSIYSAELDSSFVETEISYRYDSGDWRVLPSAWLRWQKLSLDKIDLPTPANLKNSLILEDNSTTFGGVGITMAYLGWHRFPMRTTPMLTLSYEDQISSDNGGVMASNTLINGHLIQSSKSRIQPNFSIEPSISINTSENSEFILSSWHGTAYKNHGLSVRYNARF